jgi:hypothetical protein
MYVREIIIIYYESNEQIYFLGKIWFQVVHMITTVL